MSSFTEQCPASAPFFGFIGSAAALVFASTPPTTEPLVLAFGLSALPFRTIDASALALVLGAIVARAYLREAGSLAVAVVF